MQETSQIDRQQLTDLQPLIDQNQRLLQRLNTMPHNPCESRQLISEIIGQPVRNHTEIRLPFYSDFGRHIQIGDRVFINANVTMVDLGGITIDDDALIGPGASLITVNHQMAPEHRRELSVSPIHVKHNAWVGANVTVLPGVTIGENAVVGAGAIVSKNVPANTVVVGVPAKVVKHI